jgi:hypothetical protein
VKTKVTGRLVEEMSRFQLRYACEDCAQFAPDTGACSAGYPNSEHRVAERRVEIVFCKEFELT